MSVYFNYTTHLELAFDFFFLLRQRLLADCHEHDEATYIVLLRVYLVDCNLKISE